MLKTIRFALLCFFLTCQSVATSRPIEILAIGDSHTTGYYDNGKKHAPYTQFLTSTINTSEELIHITNKAKAGANLAEIEKQAQEAFLEAAYDIVIILGGTNDLARGADLDSMQKNMRNLLDYTIPSKTSVVLLGVPDFCCFDEDIIKTRDQFNDFLMSYAKSSNQPRCVEFLNLTETLPFSDLSYWDDMTHWNPKGSAWIAKHILWSLERFVPLKNTSGQ